LTGYGQQITGNETLLADQVFVDGKMMMGIAKEIAVRFPLAPVEVVQL
jgi:hypothetical protein